MPELLSSGPFTGYVSSVPKHRVSPDKVTASSRDMLFNPFDGSFVRRKGSTIQGDTWNVTQELNGLLESKWSARARHVLQIDSPSFTDALPSYSVLYGCDTNPGFPTTDTGYFGTQYARDIAGGNNYNLLKEFGSGGTNAHYPTSGTTNAPTLNGVLNTTLKVVPLWYESGDGGYTRGASEFTRRFLTSGSRKALDASDYRFFPSLRGTPSRWNRRLNVSSASGSEEVRISPTGPFAPLFPPTHANADLVASTGSDAAWKDGQVFYQAVIFQKRDGSYTLPVLPRPVSAALAGGSGFVTIGTIGGGNKYQSRLVKDIAIGDDDTIARILCRTPSQVLAAATDLLTISFGDLQIYGILRNNTQTSFIDTLGADAGLLDDANVVRLDHMCPRRARYYFTGDQRVCASYTLPSPCGIMLAPTGNAAKRDQNLADTGAIVGANAFTVRITSTQVELGHFSGVAPNFAGGGNSVAFTYATYTTLQALVDAINATTVASLCGEWAAQLAPAVDGSLPSSSLCQTTWTSTSSTSAASTTLTVDATTLAAIPIGALIYDSAGKIAAGTYVKAKLSLTTLQLSAAASGAGSAAALQFYCDCGDEGNVGGGSTSHGYLRAYCGALPVVAYIKRRSQVGYDKPDKQSLYFTVASPGAASTGVSLAGNAWVTGNKRTVPSWLGIATGGADVDGAAIVGYSRGMRMFANVRGVNTGEDFDYRLITINDRRGCISDDSLVAVNNAAVYLTPQGVVACDKNRVEKVLSNDIHNPSTGLGDLLAEINACLQGVSADDDSGHFHAAILDAQLRIQYRSTGTSLTYPDRGHVYDFGPGEEASGLPELFQPSQYGSVGAFLGTSYGWSCPLTQRFSGMCQVARASGHQRYGAVDSNAGTADGRVDLFDDSGSGAADNSNTFSAFCYGAQRVARPFMAWNTQRMSIEHYSTSGAQFTTYRMKDRSDGSVHGLTDTTSAGSEFTREMKDCSMKQRANGEVFEWKYLASLMDGDTLWRADVLTEASHDFLTVA